jgi:hypothetical protein
MIKPDPSILSALGTPMNDCERVGSGDGTVFVEGRGQILGVAQRNDVDFCSHYPWHILILVV